MTLLVHYLWLLLSSLDYYQIYMIELIICEENGIVEGKIRVVTVGDGIWIPVHLSKIQ